MRVVTGTIAAFCMAATAQTAALAQPTPRLPAPKAAPPKAAPPEAAPSKALAAKTTTPAPPLFGLSPAPYGPALANGSPSSTGFAPRAAGSAAAELEGLFALSPAGGGDARLLSADRYDEVRGPVTWRSSTLMVAQPDGAVDLVRVSTAAAAPLARTAPLSLVRPGFEAFETSAVDVTVSRGWPSAVTLAAGRYALDVSPHAGVGFGGAGGSAEAGATVRLGRDVGNRVAGVLGVHDGHARFGDRGRWYLFAAASGQAVGLNLLRGQDGDWRRAGVTSDVSSKLIGDAQAGVGWRQGPMQASIGYIHRQIRAKDQIMGMATQEDSVVALSFSLRPHW